MKKIISTKLARDLRASINAQLAHLQHITDQLALVDAKENPQYPHYPQDQLTDAQAVGSLIEQASEALACADCMLSSHVGDSKIFSQPPAPVTWLMRQMQRIKGVHE